MPNDPEQIGRYVVRKRLAGGGTSKVYQVFDPVLERELAIKLLNEPAENSELFKTSFLIEARILSNIRHPNIVVVHDFGEHEPGWPFLVMELLQGHNLRHAILNGLLGDPASRLEIALAVARALQHIHRRGIVHRDLKPENIFLTSEGVILIDFGIARRSADAAITPAGYILGTARYMAPEQVNRQFLTAASDIYSFGLVLFELMTGSNPVSGDSVEQIFYHILFQELDLQPLEAAGVPPAVQALVAQCTCKDPAGRPYDIGAVCTLLEQTITDLRSPSLISCPPAAPAWRHHAGFAGVVVSAICVYLWLASPPPLPLRGLSPIMQQQQQPSKPLTTRNNSHEYASNDSK